MFRKVWYLAGDASIASIISRKNYVPEEVRRVDVEDEDGHAHAAYRMDAELLGKILNDIAFVNRRLASDKQIRYQIFVTTGENRVSRFVDDSLDPIHAIERLAS